MQWISDAEFEQLDALDKLACTIHYKTRETPSGATEYYALSKDELALYLTGNRRDSPGVVVIHRDGTWRYDPNLPAKDMLAQPINK